MPTVHKRKKEAACGHLSVLLLVCAFAGILECMTMTKASLAVINNVDVVIYDAVVEAGVAWLERCEIVV